MNQKWLWVIGGCLIWGTAWGQAIDERCTQNGPSACVDWERGVVIAEGLGAPAQTAENPAVRNASAQRAARLDAARNILEMIQGINLTSSTTMKEAMIANDTVKAQIQGRLNGLRPIGEPRYFSDGTIKVRLEARLLQTIPQELVLRLPAMLPKELTPGSSAPGNNASPNVNQVYTGLILDARETDAQPAMSPRVLDEQESEVYGSAYVDREFVVQNGMAGYLKDLDKAKQSDRTGTNPLVVKVLRSTGENKTDLIISNSDAAALRQMATQQSFLRQARVNILLN